MTPIEQIETFLDDLKANLRAHALGGVPVYSFIDLEDDCREAEAGDKRPVGFTVTILVGRPAIRHWEALGKGFK